MVEDISAEVNDVLEVLPTHQMDGYKKQKQRDASCLRTALVWNLFRRKNAGGEHPAYCSVPGCTHRKRYGFGSPTGVLISHMKNKRKRQ